MNAETLQIPGVEVFSTQARAELTTTIRTCEALIPNPDTLDLFDLVRGVPTPDPVMAVYALAFVKLQAIDYIARETARLAGEELTTTDVREIVVGGLPDFVNVPQLTLAQLDKQRTVAGS